VAKSTMAGEADFIKKSLRSNHLTLRSPLVFRSRRRLASRLALRLSLINSESFVSGGVDEKTYLKVRCQESGRTSEGFGNVWTLQQKR
jgi:hypothetical protein